MARKTTLKPKPGGNRKKPANRRRTSFKRQWRKLERETMLQACGTMHFSEEPLIGLLTVVFEDSYFDIMIDEEAAEELISELTDFLKGRSKNLLAVDNN